MIRKVMASGERLRASGTVTRTLGAWLYEQGHISEEQRDAATEQATAASRDLPNADRLGSLLHDAMRDGPRFDVDDIPVEHWVEGFLAIERVEPGALWFEKGIGPVPVSTEASDLAGGLERQHRARAVAAGSSSSPASSTPRSAQFSVSMSGYRKPAQLPEPVQPLLPGNGRVRRGGRRQHEERGLAEPAFLEAVPRLLAERSAICLLADERNHARSKSARELLEALGASREVCHAQIAGARCRPVRGVRDTDPESQQVELLGGVEQAGREPGCVDQAPEVVAGVGEVSAGSVREAPGVDSAEDDIEARSEDIGDRRRGRRCGYAASGSRASKRASNASRIRSVRTEGDSVIMGSPGRTTLTVSSLPLWP